MKKIMIKTGITLSLFASILTASVNAVDKNKKNGGEKEYKNILKQISYTRQLGLFPINNAEKDEILKILKLPKQYVKYVKFYGKKEAPVKGLVEYFLTIKGRPIILYKDLKQGFYFAGYLFNKEGKNLTNEFAKNIAVKQYKVFFSQIQQKAPDFVIIIKGEGPKDKKVVIYTDPQCPFCKQFEKKFQGLEFLKKNYGTIYMVEYPLSFHKESAQRAFWILNNIKKAKTADEQIKTIKAGSDKKYNEILKENKNEKNYSKELQTLRKIQVPMQFGTPTITDTEGNDIRGQIMKEIFIKKFHLNKNQIK